jgi:hypothetical protein
MHPMVLLRDEPQVEGRFGPFRDSANLDTRLVHGLRQMYLGDIGHVESRIGPLETMLLSV